MRKWFIIILVLMSCAACSKASAPPVDLPAPVTGRVDVGPTEVSSPDADGYVHITGSADSVSAGSVVMAVNETVAGSVSFRLLDILIASAYAQSSFPPVCFEAGHACTRANGDGSFELTIAGGEEDSIAFGVVDEDSGRFIGAPSRTAVPRADAIMSRRLSDDAARSGPDSTQTGQTDTSGATVSTVGDSISLGGGAADSVADRPADAGGVGDTRTSTCPAGSGRIVDVAIIPDTGMLILLKEGSATSRNALVIGTAGREIQVEGCHAHSIAVKQYGGATIVAVTSGSDKKIWRGRMDSLGNVSDARVFTLEHEPMHAAFGLSSDYVIAPIKIGGSVNLARISLVDGSYTSTPITLARGGVLGGLAVSTDLDVLPMQDDRSSPGLAVVRGASLADSYLVLFNADAASPQILRVFHIPAELSSPSGARFAKFFTTPLVAASMSAVNIAMADDAESEIQSWMITKADGTILTTASNISEFASPALDFPASAKICNPCGGQRAVALGVSQTASRREAGSIPPTFIAPMDNGTIAFSYPGDLRDPYIYEDTRTSHVFGNIAADDRARKIVVIDSAVSAGFFDATPLITWP